MVNIVAFLLIVWLFARERLVHGQDQAPRKTFSPIYHPTPYPVITDCPPGFEAHSGKCFLLLHDPKEWWDQQDLCFAQHQGQLASIEDEATNGFITRSLIEGQCGVAWIGRGFSFGRWTCANYGDTCEFNNWNKNLNEGHCGVLMPSGEWEARDCANRLPAVCSVPSRQATLTTLQPLTRAPTIIPAKAPLIHTYAAPFKKTTRRPTGTITTKIPPITNKNAPKTMAPTTSPPTTIAPSSAPTTSTATSTAPYAAPTTEAVPTLLPNFGSDCGATVGVLADPTFFDEEETKNLIDAVYLQVKQLNIYFIHAAGDIAKDLFNDLSALIIPESESGSIFSGMNINDAQAIKNFVELGGVLLTIGSNRYFKGHDVEFLNGVFGFQLQHYGSGVECERASRSRAHRIEGNFSIPMFNELAPDFLPWRNAIYCLDPASFPTEANVLYESERGESAWVIQIPTGQGYNYWMGFDFFDSEQSIQEWVTVLKLLVRSSPRECGISKAPTFSPTSQPSSTPTRSPSVQPTSIPSMQPTSNPSQQPSAQPVSEPTSIPSTVPSNQPTSSPSSLPSAKPSSQPSEQPTAHPYSNPTSVPSTQPSVQPSVIPSAVPSKQPTEQPSSWPTASPTTQPTNQPSTSPSTVPSSSPSTQPSVQPSAIPTCVPSQQPTEQPSEQPTSVPTTKPSQQPTNQPTTTPSLQPSNTPTTTPSQRPTLQPSQQPSSSPSATPTSLPTLGYGPNFTPFSVTMSVPPPQVDSSMQVTVVDTVQEMFGYPSEVTIEKISSVDNARRLSGNIRRKSSNATPRGASRIDLNATFITEDRIEDNANPTATEDAVVGDRQRLAENLVKAVSNIETAVANGAFLEKLKANGKVNNVTSAVLSGVTSVAISFPKSDEVEVDPVDDDDDDNSNSSGGGTSSGSEETDKATMLIITCIIPVLCCLLLICIGLVCCRSRSDTQGKSNDIVLSLGPALTLL